MLGSGGLPPENGALSSIAETPVDVPHFPFRTDATAASCNDRVIVSAAAPAVVIANRYGPVRKEPDAAAA
jgi:hypothetical protein